MVRKEGSLDDNVFIPIKEIFSWSVQGLDYKGKVPEPRVHARNLGNEIDQEFEYNNFLVREEKETTDLKDKVNYFWWFN